MSTHPVSAEAVRPHVDPARFDFESTDELAPGQSVGEAVMKLQPRARAALELVVATRGFHVFASGAPHLMKLDAVLAELRTASARLPRADDWLYVFNERHPERPLPLRVPGGEGPRLARLLDEALVRLERELNRVLNGGRLRRQFVALEEEAQQAEQRVLAALKAALRARHFDVRRIEGQLEALPLWKGKVVTAPLEKLRGAQRRTIEARLPEIAEPVEAANRELGEIHAGFATRHLALRNDAARELAAVALADVEREFANCPDAVAHFARLRQALVEHHGLFVEHDEKDPEPGVDPLRRFRAHVLVSQGAEASAPVLKEGRPSVEGLFGSISRELSQGVLSTHFMHLHPGALHRANGGFLVLPVRALLAQPEVWVGLLRCLRTRELPFPQGGEALATAEAMAPAPMPLECCVVLTGELELFEALYDNDPDFRELFAVRADFTDSTVTSTTSLAQAAAVIATLVRQERLPAFDASAVARCLEHAQRLAGDQQRLSLEWDRLRGLLVEAGLEAKKDGALRVHAGHLRRAEAAARWRGGLDRERLEDHVRRGLLRLQVSGAALGQVNALALSEQGDSVLGRVARVSARVGPGVRGVIDIEHGAELSGPVHVKAVMQLQGYLLGRFGAQRPMTLDATLTFEQSYFAVEGDSASVAELVALLSALADVPVHQHLAVSCSLGQDGSAQVVGGISDKIEGFFDACRVLGLDGTQGVILAAQNVQHLVLREEVVEAIAAGRFHLHAIDHVDDAVELLLGLTPAELDARVGRRLEAFRDSLWRSPHPLLGERTLAFTAPTTAPEARAPTPAPGSRR